MGAVRLRHDPLLKVLILGPQEAEGDFEVEDGVIMVADWFTVGVVASGMGVELQTFKQYPSLLGRLLEHCLPGTTSTRASSVASTTRRHSSLSSNESPLFSPPYHHHHHEKVQLSASASLEKIFLQIIIYGCYQNFQPHR